MLVVMLLLAQAHFDAVNALFEASDTVLSSLGLTGSALRNGHRILGGSVGVLGGSGGGVGSSLGALGSRAGIVGGSLGIAGGGVAGLGFGHGGIGTGLGALHRTGGGAACQRKRKGNRRKSGLVIAKGHYFLS